MKRAMKRTSRRALVGAGIVVMCGAAFLAGRVVASGIPATNALTYSGTLQDGSGAPIAGSHNIQVAFWPAATGGTTPACQTASTAIALDAGRFSIALPDACRTPVQASGDTWVEVLVDGASLGRTKLGAVPYAVEANHAVNADNASAAAAVTCPDASAPSAYGFCIWHDNNGTTYSQTHQQAAATCKTKGGRLCTFSEVSAAWHAGAQWCAYSWVSDLPAQTASTTNATTGYISYPMQAAATGCHGPGVSLDSVALTAMYDATCCK
jgi:hypothetical protein